MAREFLLSSCRAYTVNIPLSEKHPQLCVSESQLLRSLNLSGVVTLVVEDDVDARGLTKRILSDARAMVIEAATAEAALDRKHPEIRIAHSRPKRRLSGGI